MSETPFVSETREERVSTSQPTALGVTPTGQERASAGESAMPVSPTENAVVTRTSVYAGSPAYRGIQFVWFLLGLTELIIGLRVLFRALGATDTGFVSFINGLGGALAAPFRGIANYTTGNGNVIEIGSLIAMGVYVLAAFLVFKLVRIAAAPRTPAAA
jgi:hypothetical protein